MTQQKTIYQKIIDIQQRLKAPKNQYNNYGKFYYRSTEDILEALKPLLHEHSLVQTINDEIEQHGDRTYIKAVINLVDADSAESLSYHAYAREEEKRGSMDAMQLTGATSTYARKYALNGLWLIDDTKDADHPSNQKQDKSSNPNKTQNLKQAAQETKSEEPEDELTDQKSRTAYTIALGEFQELETQGQIKQQGKKIMDKARKNGIKQGDENKLRQEINQLMETLPQTKENAKSEGNQTESTEQSGQDQS